MQTSELIARLEAATGADRELDVSIQKSTGLITIPWGDNPNDWLMKTIDGYVEVVRYPGGSRTNGDRYCPRFTASIDAALTLVPRGWIVSIARDFNNDGEYVARVALTDSFTIGRGCDPEEEVSVRATVGEKRDGDDPTARALCIAALKARVVTGKSHD